MACKKIPLEKTEDHIGGSFLFVFVLLNPSHNLNAGVNAGVNVIPHVPHCGHYIDSCITLIKLIKMVNHVQIFISCNWTQQTVYRPTTE